MANEKHNFAGGRRRVAGGLAGSRAYNAGGLRPTVIGSFEPSCKQARTTG
jgi:hypothetical protein